MISALKNYLLNYRDRQRITIALSKGAAMMQARRIDLTRPGTWEFSGFSQNGEDGILDVLRSQLRKANRYFIEIGSSDGIECNCAWLVVAEQYRGIMVEGNPRLAERAQQMITGFSVGAECYNMFLKRETVQTLRSKAFHLDPDIFSLDIDGNDYYIAEAIFEAGFRPKIFVVEYNSVFGPQRSITVEYRDDFDFAKAHPTQLYYGVSIRAWRDFFERRGYRFITVDQKGVNSFFVDPVCFDTRFLKNVRGLEFAENQFQFKKVRIPSEEQFRLIADQHFVSI